MIREPDGGSSWEKVRVSLDQDVTAVSHVASWAAGGYRCYSDELCAGSQPGLFTYKPLFWTKFKNKAKIREQSTIPCREALFLCRCNEKTPGLCSEEKQSVRAITGNCCDRQRLD